MPRIRTKPKRRRVFTPPVGVELSAKDLAGVTTWGTCRPISSHGMWVNRDGDFFRYHETYRLDGQHDGRKCRYWVNGTRVSHAVFVASGGRL